jgi:hypothetical protein
MDGTGFARVFLALALVLNLVSYAAWGSTILPREDISDYLRNHAVREIVCGLVLTVTLLVTLRRPIPATWAIPLVVLSGGSVLGFWAGLLVLGGIAQIDTVFAGQTPAFAYALHVPQLIFWLIGGAMLLNRMRRAG